MPLTLLEDVLAFTERCPTSRVKLMTVLRDAEQVFADDGLPLPAWWPQFTALARAIRLARLAPDTLVQVGPPRDAQAAHPDHTGGVSVRCLPPVWARSRST